MNNEFASTTVPPEKPTMLPVLLVISYINTGFFLLVYLIGILGMFALQSMPYEEFQGAIEEQMANLPQSEEMNMEELFLILHTSGVLLFVILFLRTAVRLVGVIMMHKRMLNGFYVYAAAQLIGLFAPFIVLPWSMFGIFGPLMVVVMVALYGTQRKWLDRDRQMPAAI